MRRRSAKKGFMKLLVGANDDRILGFTMIGSEAGEVMAVVQIAMLAGGAIFGAPRRHFRAPDHGGGTGLPPREGAASFRATGHAEKCFVVGLTPAL